MMELLYSAHIACGGLFMTRFLQGATDFLQIYFYCTTRILLWFREVWFGLLKPSGSGGILKFTLVRVA